MAFPIAQLVEPEILSQRSVVRVHLGNLKIINMKEYIDRNWNLLFHRKKCVKITFWSELFGYNEILKTPIGESFRCLGNNWYKKKLGKYLKQII